MYVHTTEYIHSDANDDRTAMWTIKNLVWTDRNWGKTKEKKEKPLSKETALLGCNID